MGILSRKTEEQKITELLKEHEPVVKRVLLKDFIDENPFTDVPGYKAFFRVCHINYNPINSKSQIENFSYNGLINLKENEKYYESVGDADYIRKRMAFGLKPGKERQAAYVIAVASKGTVRTIVEEKEFRRDTKTLANVKKLVEVGSEVRYFDKYLRAVGIEKSDSVSAMIFDSHMISGDRISGKPQRPNQMIYDGWQIETGRPTPEQEEKGEVLPEYIMVRAVLDHLYGSYENARPVAGLIKEFDEMRKKASLGINMF